MRTQFVLIPSYNTGFKLQETVISALQYWPDVWVVIDGSNDGSEKSLASLKHSGLRVLQRQKNGGKGAAILDGLRIAQDSGFENVLVMDADGQHPAAEIPAFMADARRHPGAMILGIPRFDASAPRIRVWGRKISNVLVRWETGLPIADALFGFRSYPLRELLDIMESQQSMRGYDFDTEALVRLCWRGIPLRQHRVAVQYFRPEEGGISHFHYLRDNLRLAQMHLRLLTKKFLR